jgi:hypothetical protein
MPAGTRKPYVLLLVPLLMAVVLITLAIPVTCSMAMPQQTPACDVNAPVQGGHTGMPVSHSPAPQPQGGGHACSYTTVATQALSPDNFRFLGAALLVAALAVMAAPAVLTPVARLARVVIEPSPPPGLVLAVAQLRV